MNEELEEHNRKRDALFRNPTLVAAVEFWKEQGQEDWARPDVPLATVHKARLQWLEATDEMLAESIKWLKEHGYETTAHGVPPLTPETRDAQRAILGWKPLNE